VENAAGTFGLRRFSFSFPWQQAFRVSRVSNPLHRKELHLE